MRCSPLPLPYCSRSSPWLREAVQLQSGQAWFSPPEDGVADIAALLLNVYAAQSTAGPGLTSTAWDPKVQRSMSRVSPQSDRIEVTFEPGLEPNLTPLLGRALVVLIRNDRPPVIESTGGSEECLPPAVAS